MNHIYGNDSTHLTLTDRAERIYSVSDPLRIEETETEDGYRYGMTDIIEADNLTEQEVSEYIEGLIPDYSDAPTMERFASLSSDAPHAYDAETIATMSDADLVDTINSLPDWDADLLHDLIWRAYGKAPAWEVGDAICYDAAFELGYKLQ